MSLSDNRGFFRQISTGSMTFHEARIGAFEAPLATTTDGYPDNLMPSFTAVAGNSSHNHKVSSAVGCAPLLAPPAAPKNANAGLQALVDSPFHIPCYRRCLLSHQRLNVTCSCSDSEGKCLSLCCDVCSSCDNASVCTCSCSGMCSGVQSGRSRIGNTSASQSSSCTCSCSYPSCSGYEEHHRRRKRNIFASGDAFSKDILQAPQLLHLPVKHTDNHVNHNVLPQPPLVNLTLTERYSHDSCTSSGHNERTQSGAHMRSQLYRKDLTSVSFGTQTEKDGPYGSCAAQLSMTELLLSESATRNQFLVDWYESSQVFVAYASLLTGSAKSLGRILYERSTSPVVHHCDEVAATCDVATQHTQTDILEKDDDRVKERLIDELKAELRQVEEDTHVLRRQLTDALHETDTLRMELVAVLEAKKIYALDAFHSMEATTRALLVTAAIETNEATGRCFTNLCSQVALRYQQNAFEETMRRECTQVISMEGDNRLQLYREADDEYRNLMLLMSQQSHQLQLGVALHSRDVAVERGNSLDECISALQDELGATLQRERDLRIQLLHTLRLPTTTLVTSRKEMNGREGTSLDTSGDDAEVPVHRRFARAHQEAIRTVRAQQRVV